MQQYQDYVDTVHNPGGEQFTYAYVDWSDDYMAHSCHSIRESVTNTALSDQISDNEPTKIFGPTAFPSPPDDDGVLQHVRAGYLDCMDSSGNRSWIELKWCPYRCDFYKTIGGTKYYAGYRREYEWSPVWKEGSRKVPALASLAEKGPITIRNWTPMAYAILNDEKVGVLDLLWTAAKLNISCSWDDSVKDLQNEVRYALEEIYNRANQLPPK